MLACKLCRNVLVIKVQGLRQSYGVVEMMGEDAKKSADRNMQQLRVYMRWDLRRFPTHGDTKQSLYGNHIEK